MNLNKCCGKNPIHWVPIVKADGKQMDETLEPSIQCQICKCSVRGEDDNELELRWNSINLHC